MPRHAEIAGAGFAGLAAAVALRQRGWTVRVHEKGPELRAFGAGIYVWHNGLRALDALGALPDILPGSTPPPYYETRRNNQTVSKEVFGPMTLRVMTRQHLHTALANAARREGVDIVLRSEVVSADAAGMVTLDSGKTLSADLVIGADGVGSKVRDSIGFTLERTTSRDGLIRLLVPRMKRELGEGEWDNIIDFWNFEPRMLRVLYSPCNEEHLYLGLMAPAVDVQGSQVPINLAVWVENFPHLAPVLAEAAKVPARYDRYETTVLGEWTRGKVALVGDSAHAMCPALAQGAGCAMVNALSLAMALEEHAGVTEAMTAWEQRMRPLTGRCQARSAALAATRGMSLGSRFDEAHSETLRYDPVGRALNPIGRIACLT